MRVVICLQERIDPAAARALARLLFRSEPPVEPSSTPEQEHGPAPGVGDGGGESLLGRTPRGGGRVKGRPTPPPKPRDR